MKPLVKKVWSQSLARRKLLGGDSQNPSIAAKSLLSARVVGRAERVLKRRFGRKRRAPNNPVPAIAGLLGGGLPSLGRRVDPKKHGQRAAAVERVALKASAGDQGALEQLQRIANGLEWPGQWADLQQLARQHLELVASKLEAQATKRAEELAARREAAAAEGARAERREERLTGAFASVGGALASSFGRRGSLRPKRRRRRRSSYY